MWCIVCSTNLTRHAFPIRLFPLLREKSFLFYFPTPIPYFSAVDRLGCLFAGCVWSWPCCPLARPDGSRAIARDGSGSGKWRYRRRQFIGFFFLGFSGFLGFRFRLPTPAFESCSLDRERLAYGVSSWYVRYMQFLQNLSCGRMNWGCSMCVCRRM